MKINLPESRVQVRLYFYRQYLISWSIHHQFQMTFSGVSCINNLFAKENSF